MPNIQNVKLNSLLRMHFVGDEEFFGLAYLIGELIKKNL
jgi:hypothetical protein